MKLYELTLPKNSWEVLISNADKEEAGSELINLVKHAYSTTPHGSFVNSIRDVIPSDWKVIDWDHKPDVDATVFYRRNRAGETWIGHKIQGIGHDGQQASKEKAVAKVQELLGKQGWWIESSDAMQHVLMRMSVSPVNDPKFLRRLFGDNIKINYDGSYTRLLSDGKKVTEMVFGHPTLK